MDIPEGCNPKVTWLADVAVDMALAEWLIRIIVGTK
jgi:hypothetical protein